MTPRPREPASSLNMGRVEMYTSIMDDWENKTKMFALLVWFTSLVNSLNDLALPGYVLISQDTILPQEERARNRLQPTGVLQFSW